MHPQEYLLIPKEQMDQLSYIPPVLIKWYHNNARTLPWREDSTPYHVWISEIMLQQTRVEAVKGYYRRFLAALPTMEALAEVPEDALLKLWEGLGYYNRARNLQKAARVVLRQFDGKLPASYHALLTLPGIGEYTAGAVASIAFGIAVPAVDGNVLRVFSRITTSYADISLPQVKQSYRQLISEILPSAYPGDFNQAVMDLGATICLPNGAPLCTQCPVSQHCGGYRAGIVSELPVKAAKKARKIEKHTILLIVANKKALLFRRGSGLLGGMYEPLNLDGHVSREEASNAVLQLGGAAVKEISLSVSKHLFTHIEWRMKGYLVYSTHFSPPENAVWVDADELDSGYALPSAFRAYTKDISFYLE